MHQQNIFTYISRAIVSGLLMIFSINTNAQDKMFKIQKDSVPVMKGFAVSFDLIGAGMLVASDYGQYEGALRVNLHDQLFPIIEIGIGKADHEELLTGVTYKTNWAPYGRIGCDVNILRKKHTGNRFYVGLRYAFTSFKATASASELTDPVWQRPTPYTINEDNSKYHWMEVIAGIDAKIWGPLHLGWSARFKQRIARSTGQMQEAWYVPGFGKGGSSRLGGTFNVIIDI